MGDPSSGNECNNHIGCAIGRRKNCRKMDGRSGREFGRRSIYNAYSEFFVIRVPQRDAQPWDYACLARFISDRALDNQGIRSLYWIHHDRKAVAEWRRLTVA